MQTVIRNGMEDALKCVLPNGVRLKHEDDKPHVMMAEESGEDPEYIALCLYMYHGEGENNSKCFEGANPLPLRLVLKRCLFDLNSFMSDVPANTQTGLAYAFECALNALGTICFMREGEELMARFEFANHFVNFYFEEEDIGRFFSIEEP